MLSRETIKHITSLQQKKYRELHGEYIVEGVKAVSELLTSSAEVKMLCCKKEWFEQNSEICAGRSIQPEFIDDTQLARISNFKNPNSVLAVVKIKPVSIDDVDLNIGITLILDDIRDPGNMGTIIRSADWFGLTQIVCSLSSVDVYNPKVIQSSMGSFLRVSVVYCDLEEVLKKAGNISVYGAFMHGAAVYTIKKSIPAIIVVGNESKGISENLEKYISQKISIPLFSKTNRISNPESLNVAVAAGIIMNEFRKS